MEEKSRKGLTKFEAIKLMRERNYFGSMMVEPRGGLMLLSLGLPEIIPTQLNQFLEVIGKRDDVKKVLGMYIMNTKKGNLFLHGYNSK